MDLGIGAALVYGGLAIAGGLMGYFKSQSQVSLISGSISGVLLILGAILALQGQPWGLGLAAGVTLLLVITFIVRWFKTRKVMPAGVMVIAGAIAFALMVF